MPRSTREWALRKLKESEGNIEWAENHLAEVGQLYEKDHPEISVPLLQIIGTLQAIQEFIAKLRSTF